MRCPLSGTIEDHQLMFDEHRLRNYGANAARPRESSKSNDEMNEKDDKITHLGRVTNLKLLELPAHFVIRQEHPSWMLVIRSRIYFWRITGFSDANHPSLPPRTNHPHPFPQQ